MFDIPSIEHVLLACVMRTLNGEHSFDCCQWYIILLLCAGETIAQEILATLDNVGLPLAQCVGQAYDGASNMSGSRSGTAAIIAQQNPMAVYTHCKAHTLNLALMKSCKVVPQISESLLFNCWFIVYSICIKCICCSCCNLTKCREHT